MVIALIVAPIVVALIDGDVSWFAVVYGAEALVLLVAGVVRRRLGLPTWTANEAYISRLRRWHRSRHT